MWSVFNNIMILKYIRLFYLCMIINIYFCKAFQGDVAIVNRGKKYSITTDYQSSDYVKTDEKWLEIALQDIAYYLRNHKFNEWDRRYYKNKPELDLVGFYVAFPTPSLKYIHWKVYKHCHEDFIKCVTYLHDVVQTAPFTRSDDLVTSLNKHFITVNVTSLENQDKECKKALLYTEKTGIPFGGPREKFIWRTSASYYMCWYAMKGVPALSMLGESCDNFASCLDITHGNRNQDPRANDKSSFACAIYSFCPDPCCPLKHVYRMVQCYNSMFNPCYIENVKNADLSRRRCIFKREYNKNLENIIENKWNVTCHCQRKGFTWNSQYGMCVDINECITKQHKCDVRNEDCLNLPGTYRCVCKFGYIYDKLKNKCIEQGNLLVVVEEERNSFDFARKLGIRDILQFINIF